MFSINASRRVGGFICGVRMPLIERAAGGLDRGILYMLTGIRFDSVIVRVHEEGDAANGQLTWRQYLRGYLCAGRTHWWLSQKRAVVGAKQER